MAPREQRFQLVDTDPNITEDSTFGTTRRETWKYKVPDGTEIILSKGDEFSLYAEDSGDAEYTDPGALVQIEVRDASEQKVINVYGPNNYKCSTEFQERKKIAKLQLDAPIRVKSREYIVILTTDDTGMDSASVANSYCRLLCTKRVLS